MFEMNWSPLDPAHPEWGQAALLPWDCEVFGFAVADFTLGEVPAVYRNLESFRKSLCDWATKNNVELVGCSVPADDTRAIQLLPELGFRYVDYSYTITQPHTRDFAPPPLRRPVRLAEPQDQADVERIAEHAFQFGRYHIDPLFPREAADLRYRRWLQNAFATLGGNNVMYVIGDPGHVGGFFYATLEGALARISIIAVDRALQRSPISVDLCNAVFHEMQKRGIRRMVSKISASNLSILNIAIHFGFRCSRPLTTFHWHAPNAAHLLRPDQVLG